MRFAGHSHPKKVTLLAEVKARQTTYTCAGFHLMATKCLSFNYRMCLPTSRNITVMLLSLQQWIFSVIILLKLIVFNISD